MKMQKNYDDYHYVEGNTVRKIGVEYYGNEEREYQREYQEEVIRRRRKRRQVKTPSIDLISLVFMVAAIITTAYVCVQYLKVQADVTNMNKSIVSMERNIVTMKNDNNAAIEDITSAIDIQYIYKVATEELGMVHADKNQIISYESNKSNSVKQYGDIPKGTDKSLVERILGNK